MDAERLAYAALAYPALLFSLSVHEWGHAMSAKLLGDRTAEEAGRLTLNPIAHIDPVGTVLFPLMGMLSPGLGRFIFGWAKPVPVNPMRLRRMSDIMWVSLAGPACNLALAAISVIALKIHLSLFADATSAPGAEILVRFLMSMIGINLILMWFNLIPLAPLDGSKVLLAQIPGTSPHLAFWRAYEAYGPFILLGLFFTGGLRLILEGPMRVSFDVIIRFLMIGEG